MCSFKSVNVYRFHGPTLTHYYTDYYWVKSQLGHVVEVFCDMERVCGCSGGRGWMRVANIDITRPNEDCPEGFRKVTSNGKTMCGGQSSQIISTTFPLHGFQYSQVCGRIIGYQFYKTNAFHNYIVNGGSIDSFFVDGIVLTHGSPRTHIWTFTTGHHQYHVGPSGCPCNDGSQVTIYLLMLEANISVTVAMDKILIPHHSI